MDSLAKRTDQQTNTELQELVKKQETKDSLESFIHEFHIILEELMYKIGILIEKAEDELQDLQTQNADLKQNLLKAERDLIAKIESLGRAKRKVKHLTWKEETSRHIFADAVLHWDKEIQRMRQEYQKNVQRAMEESHNACDDLSLELENLKKRLLGLSAQVIGRDETPEMASKRKEMSLCEDELEITLKYASAYWEKDLRKIDRTIQNELKRAIENGRKTIDDLRMENELLNAELSDVKEQLNLKDFTRLTVTRKLQEMKKQEGFIRQPMDEYLVRWKNELLGEALVYDNVVERAFKRTNTVPPYPCENKKMFSRVNNQPELNQDECPIEVGHQKEIEQSEDSKERSSLESETSWQKEILEITQEFDIKVEQAMRQANIATDDLLKDEEVNATGLHLNNKQLDEGSEKAGQSLKLDEVITEEPVVNDSERPGQERKIQQCLIKILDHLVKELQVTEACFLKTKEELERKLLDIRQQYTFMDKYIVAEIMKDMKMESGQSTLPKVEKEPQQPNEAIQELENLLKSKFLEVGEKLLNLKQKFVLIKQHTEEEGHLFEISCLALDAIEEEENLEECSISEGISSGLSDGAVYAELEEDMTVEEKIQAWIKGKSEL